MVSNAETTATRLFSLRPLARTKMREILVVTVIQLDTCSREYSNKIMKERKNQDNHTGAQVISTALEVITDCNPLSEILIETV